MSVADAVAELKGVFEGDFKTEVARLEAETKKNGEASGETKQAISRMNDRMDAMEAAATKAALYADRDSDHTGRSQDRKDFETFTRTGTMPEGTKVMTVSDESQGGVLAPSDFIAEMIKGVIEFSPIRGIAKVRSTTARSSKFPKRTGLAAAVWTGERGTRTPTASPRYGLEEVPNHELYARILVSQQDLEDANAIDLEADVMAQMAEQFGGSEGAGFISGDSNGKPEGILVNADIEQIHNGATTFGTTNGANGLFDLKFGLKEAYHKSSTMVLQRLTLRDIRKMKDSNSNYIWAPGIGQGAGVAGYAPATIVDTPYLLCADMPAVTSGSLSVACGDFGKGYMISDRIVTEWLRDPYSAAADGAVVFHARKRVGGQVVLPEAIKLLVMSA